MRITCQKPQNYTKYHFVISQPLTQSARFGLLGGARGHGLAVSLHIVAAPRAVTLSSLS